MFRRLTHTILTHKGLMYKNRTASHLSYSEKENNPENERHVFSEWCILSEGRFIW